MYLVFQSEQEQDVFDKIFTDVSDDHIRLIFKVDEVKKKYLEHRQQDLMHSVNAIIKTVISPPRFVFFGAALASAWFGKRVGVTTNRKQIFRASNMSAQASFTFSPSVDPTLLNEIASDLRWSMREIKDPMQDVSRLKIMSLPEFDGEAVAFDVETVGEPWAKDSYIRCAAVAGDKVTVYGSPDEKTINPWLYEFIKKAKCGMGTMLVGHNIKSDLLRLYRQLPKLRHLFMFPDLIDTWVGVTMLDENAIGQGLKQVCAKYLDIETWGNDIDLEHCDKVEYQKLLDYCMTDASMSYIVAPLILKELKQQGLDTLFRWVMKAEREIVEMELNGLKIDREIIKPVRKQVLSDLVILSRKLDKIAPSVNIDSPVQLSAFLYKTLKLPVVATTEGGAGSTGEDALVMLLDDDKIADNVEAQEYISALLEYRKAKKLWDGYIHNIDRFIAEDGRIHSTFVIGKDEENGTVTGRLSSKDPNLQNPPRGKMIRQLFIPEAGYVLIGADYSQIELRIIAHYANDPVMIEAFRRGHDLHTATLAHLQKVEYDVAKSKVDSKEWEEERSIIKQINFGIPYGIGAGRLRQLARKVGIHLTYKAAQNQIEEWFNNFPGVRAYIDQTHAMAIRLEEVSDLFGRKRRLIGASTDSSYGLALLRQATNQRIQSSAADMCLIAMALVGELTRESLLRNEIRMVHQLHDSIMCEVKADKVREAQEIMEAAMTTELQHVMKRDFNVVLSVPLKVDFKIYTERWG